MLARRLSVISAVVFGLLFLIAPSYGQLSATATIYSVPNGANFDYTLTLTNNGGSNIGTFWFAWTPPNPEYDFLTANPTALGQPTGWVGASSLGFPGYSIEWFNSTGSLIAPTQSGTFLFTSHDTPAQMQSLVFGVFPVTESFVYAGPPVPAVFGTPPPGDSAQVNPAFVAAPSPEPSSLILLALGCAGAVCTRRRKISA